MQDLISNAKQYITELFSENSGGHDVEHSIRVYQNALYIAEREGASDLQTISLAALLHDADDHKLFDTTDNANARAFLAMQKIPEAETEVICTIINSVSFSQNRGRRPETLEAMIVQDADRLDALGAIGIARTFAFGGEHGRTLESSVQHFYDKLLLLKDEMNTKTAKELAESRHQFLVRFLEEWKEEAGIGSASVSGSTKNEAL